MPRNDERAAHDLPQTEVRKPDATVHWRRLMKLSAAAAGAFLVLWAVAGAGLSARRLLEHSASQARQIEILENTIDALQARLGSEEKKSRYEEVLARQCINRRSGLIHADHDPAPVAGSALAPALRHNTGGAAGV